MITSQKTVALMSGLCSLIPSIKWPSIVLQGIERRSDDVTKTRTQLRAQQMNSHTYPLTEETRHSDNVCDHFMTPELQVSDGNASSDHDGELSEPEDNTLTLDFYPIEHELEFDEHGAGSDADVNDDNEKIDAVGITPLCEGSPLTLAASSGLMKFKMRHNLTYEGLQDLLSLIKIHCPSPNNCITSLYKFRKQFGSNSAILHYFCSACYHNVTANSSVCTNPLCKNNLTKEGGRSSFIEVPVAAQFQKLLERKYSSVIPTVHKSCMERHVHMTLYRYSYIMHLH